MKASFRRTTGISSRSETIRRDGSDQRGAALYWRIVAVGDISSHASIGSLVKQAAVSSACNEGMAVLPADSLVEWDQSISVAAAIRATAAKAVIIRRFMEAYRSGPIRRKVRTA